LDDWMMNFKGTVYVAWTESIGLRIGQLAGSFKYCNEILFTILCGIFFSLAAKLLASQGALCSMKLTG
jgi:hypothetical protein